MAFFSAKVKDASGTRRSLLREADTSAEVAAQLRTEGLLVISVEEAKGPGSLPSRWNPSWLLPMSSFDVEMGLRQLASMLKSGVSLLEALRTTEEQSRCPRAMRAWRGVRDRVLSGDSFADALDADHRRFGEMAVRMARVGEQSGELDIALTRAADHLERRRNLRTMVINALVYPVMAVLMAVGVSVFLVVSVIPKVAAFLQSGGATLPPITQFLLDISDWTTRHGVHIVIGIAGAVALWWIVRLSSAGREMQDAFLLKIPISGKILRLSATAVLARALQTMLSSGVSLLDSLEVGGRLLSNTRCRRRIAEVREEVMRGTSLATAFMSAPEFMPMLGRMSAVGEVTGSLADTFGETARFHEMMLAVAIKRFSVLIEPVMIVITGVIVGFVYIAFFTAIFAMANAN